MNFRILNKALHNNGYRYVGKKEGIHVYGKPIGYGYLCAYVCDVDAGANLEITLIVKEKQQQKDGTRPLASPLVWLVVARDTMLTNRKY